MSCERVELASLPAPYYEDDSCTIYHGDCFGVLPLLETNGALVLTDPPYGINHPTEYGSRGRANLAKCKDYPRVAGDNRPFDPSPLLSVGTGRIIWGGNHFSSRLPNSSGWLVWDKRRPDALDQSTCELAWTDCVKGVRRFGHLWNGCMKASERGESYHPTQKPVALMEWVLSLRWTSAFNLILDPFMGCGPTLVAARNLGRKAIGIELSEEYCEIAAKRLQQPRQEALI